MLNKVPKKHSTQAEIDEILPTKKRNIDYTASLRNHRFIKYYK